MKMDPKSNVEFRVFTVEKGQPIYTGVDAVEVRPVAAVVKPDGCTDNSPSMAIFFVDGKGGKWVGQISLEMFKPVISHLFEAEKRQQAETLFSRNPSVN